MELWKQPWRSASPGSALAGTCASPSPQPLLLPPAFAPSACSSLPTRSPPPRSSADVVRRAVLASFYSDDLARPNHLFTSTTLGAAGEHYWRDYLLSKPSTSVHHPPAAMEYLLSAAASHSMLPEHRPPASSAVAALPVIDLSAPRDVVRRAVLKADRELGFFQVNHGVPAQAVRGMEASCKAFFCLPAEDMAAIYSDDTARPNRLFTSTTHGAAGVHYWRAYLRLTCGTFPVAADTQDAWPVPTRSSHGVLVATGSAMKVTPQKIRVGVVGLTRCNSCSNSWWGPVWGPCLLGVPLVLVPAFLRLEGMRPVVNMWQGSLFGGKIMDPN